jgi:hypothetical protein
MHESKVAEQMFREDECGFTLFLIFAAVYLLKVYKTKIPDSLRRPGFFPIRWFDYQMFSASRWVLQSWLRRSFYFPNKRNTSRSAAKSHRNNPECLG